MFLANADAVAGLTELGEEDWVEVARFRTRSSVRDGGLVLAAAGIDYRLNLRPTGLGMFVRARDHDLAVAELTAFREESAGRVTATINVRPFAQGFPGALAYGVIIVALFQMTLANAFGVNWVAAGAVQAGLMDEGQLWRAVTALGLHGDNIHLIGNLLGGAFLGMILAQIIGSGLTWLAFVATGALGNMLNAAVHPATHTSVGASTAVFGLLGVLSVVVLKPRAATWNNGLRRWLPLATGFTLLGFWGFGGGRTDVGAHIAGFAAGAVVGAALWLGAQRLPSGATAQRVYGALAAGGFGLAWWLALAAFSQQ